MRRGRYLRAALAFAMLGSIAVLVLRVRSTSRDAARERTRADRAEQSITDACTRAALQITLTLRALDENPTIGLALAARDAGFVQLCGGELDAVRNASLRGDVLATRSGLLDLQRWWCPTCEVADQPNRVPGLFLSPAFAEARQPAGTVVPDGPPPLQLDAAVMAADPLDVDATALGTSIEVRLVRQLQGMNGTMRHFNLLLVVSGARLLVVPIEGEGFGKDGDSMPDEAPVGTLVAVAPLTPTAVWDDDPIEAPVPVRAPLLYRVAFHIPGGNDDVAVVRDGDRIKVFYFWRDEGNSATAWELQAEVRLPPGAALRAW